MRQVVLRVAGCLTDDEIVDMAETEAAAYNSMIGDIYTYYQHEYTTIVFMLL